MEDNSQRQDKKIVKVLREIVEGKDCPNFYLEFSLLDLRSNEIIGFEALAAGYGRTGPNRAG